jgi:ketosteroid isomerase-like protein
LLVSEDANVALVRKLYDAWLRGESTRAWVDPELEYVNPPNAVEPGTVRGRETLGRWRDAYDEFRIEPERIEAVDADDVLVVARVRTRGRGSGAITETRQGYIWTVKDGKAVRFQWFRDPADALAAVGLG